MLLTLIRFLRSGAMAYAERGDMGGDMARRLLKGTQR
jgi:hypothetical protein